jgi:hypothetical protein
MSDPWYLSAMINHSMNHSPLGVCPTISIDNADGVTLYLSEQCVDVTQVFTAKSSEMNVLFKTPTMKEDDDLLEEPIPEQFMTRVTKQGTLVTDPVQYS